jgi:hypothetical protein
MTRRRRRSPGSFREEGRRYVVTDPHWMDTADADLCSQMSHLKISHRGQMDTSFPQPNATRYAESLRSPPGGRCRQAWE